MSSTTRSARALRPGSALAQAAVAALIATSVAVALPRHAQATCLGLPLSPPKDLNICRRLVEDLVIDPVKRCGRGCPLLPECCVQASCLVFPECVIVEAAGYVVHAGEVYCGMQEIDPAEMVDDLVNERYTELTTLATGGANSALYTVAGTHVDMLECAAKRLPDALKTVMRRWKQLPGVPSNYLQDVDLDAVRILNKGYGGAGIYLQKGYSAITLGSLVIMGDTSYDKLVGWSHDWYDTLFRLTAEERSALMTMLHEMVHVRQYRELGREQFLNQYLPEALAKGYGDVSFENEAYGVGTWAEEAYTRVQQAISWISSFMP